MKMKYSRRRYVPKVPNSKYILTSYLLSNKINWLKGFQLSCFDIFFLLSAHPIRTTFQYENLKLDFDF